MMEQTFCDLKIIIVLIIKGDLIFMAKTIMYKEGLSDHIIVYILAHSCYTV